MHFSFKFGGLLDQNILDKENSKLVAMILKDKKLEDDAKLERKEKRADKIIAWTKNDIKCKSYIGQMCLDHIQQEFQAVKTEWLAHNSWEWLKKGYISFRTPPVSRQPSLRLMNLPIPHVKIGLSTARNTMLLKLV